MPEIKASIIIPAFNNQAAACLESLAAHAREDMEVIVVENASSNNMSEEASSLGKRLFGSAFQHIRNGEERNYAECCNQAANAAHGEYLVFLDNSIEVQENWLGPLLRDFAEFSGIGATAPLLLGKEETPLGRLVHHLGVTVSPTLAFSHLYAGMPETFTPGRKRRFFQAISSACMVIPKKLFFDAGAFDERFHNGLEDFDLCARLWAKNLRMTVNPASRAIYGGCHSPAPSERQLENAILSRASCLEHFCPDWPIHLKSDGFCLTVSPWLQFQPAIPAETESRLERMLASADPGQLKHLLAAYPYWEKGWQRLLAKTEDASERASLFNIYFRLFPTPDAAFMGFAMSSHDPKRMARYIGHLKSVCHPPPALLEAAKEARGWCANIGMPEMADQYGAWIDAYDNFKKNIHPPFIKKLASVLHDEKAPLNPARPEDYGVWRQISASAPPPGSATAFSIVMPVFNPRPEHFRAALGSILAQSHANWELCIADDASTEPHVREIINEYMERDRRVAARFRERNGHIAQATNTAIDMARNPWTAFMDQDDLLAPDALARMACAIDTNPGALLFYSDEDKTFNGFDFFNPYLKGRWDPILLLQQNFVCHLTVCETKRLAGIRLRTEYNGAQDHDMLLRFSAGLDDSRIVHVPHVLYHWRIHENSTAMGVEAKNYARDAGLAAVQAHLDAASPGAKAQLLPNQTWYKIAYPMPEKQPVIAVVSQLELAKRKLLRQSASLPLAIVPAASKIPDNAEYILFLDPGFIRFSRGWLEELVSIFARPDVGAVGAALWDTRKNLRHAGYMFDAENRLKPLFANTSPIEGKWFGWKCVARSVDALDGGCLLVKREIFEQLGGFEPEKPWAAQQFCLAMRSLGLRSVWDPHAQITVEKHAPEARNRHFDEKFTGFIKPFNDNLIIRDGGLILNADRP